MKKTFKKNLAQVLQQVGKNQVIDQRMETAIKGGDVVVIDIML